MKPDIDKFKLRRCQLGLRFGLIMMKASECEQLANEPTLHSDKAKEDKLAALTHDFLRDAKQFVSDANTFRNDVLRACGQSCAYETREFALDVFDSDFQDPELMEQKDQVEAFVQRVKPLLKTHQLHALMARNTQAFNMTWRPKPVDWRATSKSGLTYLSQPERERPQLPESGLRIGVVSN